MPDPARSEIAAFFDDFVTAFASFSGAEVARLYRAPAIALRADGTQKALSSFDDIANFFQSALDTYRREGARTATWHDLEVVPMGAASALGTVSWKLIASDGGLIRAWRQSYVLTRDRVGWRAISSVSHATC